MLLVIEQVLLQLCQIMMISIIANISGYLWVFLGISGYSKCSLPNAPHQMLPIQMLPGSNAPWFKCSPVQMLPGPNALCPNAPQNQMLSGPNALRSKCSPVQMLPGPNAPWSKCSPVQILSGPNDL